jgi:hypothetical protein
MEGPAESRTTSAGLLLCLALSSLGLAGGLGEAVVAVLHRLVPSGRPEYGVLIASAILSVAIGFYSPDSAMYAYFLNLASPLVRRWTERV